MDVIHVVQGITFTWGRRKAVANLGKHGVPFETACEVFFDPFLQLVGEQEKDGELREAVIGMTKGWRLLVVAFVIRAETVRIISARTARPSERERYEDN